MSTSPPAVTNEVRVLDLFSGAGGLSEGLRVASARFSTVRAVESDPAAAATYEANHGTGKVFAGLIQDWLRAETVPVADLVIGGPPCQGFSALGKQDVNDERNHLWQFYAHSIRAASPKYFVLENVPAFLSSDQFARFKNVTRGNGALRNYTFQAKILNAAQYGAAQVRKRLVLIGHHRDLDFPGFPEVDPDFASSGSWRTVRDAFGNLEQRVDEVDLPDRHMQFSGKEMSGTFRSDELHLGRRYEQLSIDRMKHIPEGGNRFNLPEKLKADCWRNHTSGSADVMGRLSWDRPSVTIRTEFYKPEKGRYLHPTENRAITHHEAARIQGFRDDYLWVGSKTAIGKQIGNAVPIPLAKAVGEQILMHL